MQAIFELVNQFDDGHHKETELIVLTTTDIFALQHFVLSYVLGHYGSVCHHKGNEILFWI